MAIPAVLVEIIWYIFIVSSCLTIICFLVIFCLHFGDRKRKSK